MLKLKTAYMEYLTLFLACVCITTQIANANTPGSLQKVSVPQAQADRTFDCHDQIPADMTIAQLGRGSQKLVINLAGGPGSCAFDLDHIGADGVRTRLSTHPGGYLMASLNRLNDNSLVACATRIETLTSPAPSASLRRKRPLELGTQSCSSAGRMIAWEKADARRRLHRL